MERIQDIFISLHLLVNEKQMLIKELRDLFVSVYKLECTKQRPPVQPIDLPEQLIALWISQARIDILGKLKITKSLIDLVIPIGENIFSLPHDFGSVISCEYGGIPLKKVGVDDIRTTGASTAGTPDQYAIFSDSEGMNILFSPDVSSATIVRIWYNVGACLTLPSHKTLKDNFGLPDAYVQPAIDFMLDKAIGGYEAKYLNQLSVLRQLGNGETSDNKISYVMN